MRASKSRCRKESAEERCVGRSMVMAPRAERSSSRYSSGMPTGYLVRVRLGVRVRVKG